MPRPRWRSLDDSIRKVVLRTAARLLRDGCPGFTVERIPAVGIMPQGSLPALVVPISPETVPLPGEHQSIGGVNVRIHIDVGIFARSAGVGLLANDDFCDQLEDYLTAITAALAVDPSLGGHLDWLEYSGCEPSILASDAPIPTAFWLIHFQGQYMRAQLDTLHANN